MSILVFAILSLIVPLILAVGIWIVQKDKFEMPMRFFTLYLATSVVFEIIGYVFRKAGIPNAWRVDVFTLVEVYFFGFILYCVIKSTRLSTLLKWSTVSWFVLYIILKIVDIEPFGMNTYNRYSRPIALLLLAILSCTTLVHLLTRNSYQMPKKTYLIWLCFGIMIYSVGNAMVYSNIPIVDQDILEAFKYIYHVLYIVTYITFLAAVLLYFRQTKNLFKTD
ncbi:MAG: hypothetical protein KDH98_22525 [Calditrichaeota bacterium]|nr:hypothetical protein [Calditrichota bacterium]